MERIIWLTAFVVLIGIEAATMTLCTIWFAIGALVSFFLTLAGVGNMASWRRFCGILCAVLLYKAGGAAVCQSKDSEDKRGRADWKEGCDYRGRG